MVSSHFLGLPHRIPPQPNLCCWRKTPSLDQPARKKQRSYWFSGSLLRKEEREKSTIWTEPKTCLSKVTSKQSLWRWVKVSSKYTGKQLQPTGVTLAMEAGGRGDESRVGFEALRRLMTNETMEGNLPGRQELRENGTKRGGAQHSAAGLNPQAGPL